MPDAVDGDGVGDDGVKGERSCGGVRVELADEIGVDGINGDHGDGPLFGDDGRKGAAHFPQKRQRQRDDGKAVDEAKDGRPHARGAVDEGEVVAPRTLVESAAGKSEKIEHFGIGPALGEGGVEAARGGVVALAIAGGEEQDFRRHGRGVDRRAWVLGK